MQVAELRCGIYAFSSLWRLWRLYVHWIRRGHAVHHCAFFAHRFALNDSHGMKHCLAGGRSLEGGIEVDARVRPGREG